MRSGIISKDKCDSNHTAIADTTMISSIRHDQAAATTTPYGRSVASFSRTRADIETLVCIGSAGWLAADGFGGVVKQSPSVQLLFSVVHEWQTVGLLYQNTTWPAPIGGTGHVEILKRLVNWFVS